MYIVTSEICTSNFDSYNQDSVHLREKLCENLWLLFEAKTSP